MNQPSVTSAISWLQQWKCRSCRVLSWLNSLAITAWQLQELFQKFTRRSLHLAQSHLLDHRSYYPGAGVKAEERDSLYCIQVGFFSSITILNSLSEVAFQEVETRLIFAFVGRSVELAISKAFGCIACFILTGPCSDV